MEEALVSDPVGLGLERDPKVGLQQREVKSGIRTVETEGKGQGPTFQLVPRGFVDVGGTEDGFLLASGLLAPVGELDPILSKDRKDLIEKFLDISGMIRGQLESILWGQTGQGKKGDSNP